MTDDHVVLIVEDDAGCADALLRICASLGHRARVATTLAEARAAIAEGGFCYGLVDMEIPAETGGPPMVTGGETALAGLRRSDIRRNEEDHHLLQLLVVSGYARDPDFVDRTRDLGGDGFIAKPVLERIESVAHRIRIHLERAGRLDHARCTAIWASAPSHRGEVRVRVAFEGAKRRRRTTLVVNAQRLEIRDAEFALLLGLAVRRLLDPEAWSTLAELGAASAPGLPSAIGKALASALPGGFQILENNRSGGYRLNPKVVVEPIDHAALARHDDPAVQKLARRLGKHR